MKILTRARRWWNDGSGPTTRGGRTRLAVQPLEDRTTPTGAVELFPYPDTYSTASFGIAAGPDGNLWFTENENGGVQRIGRITPQGRITEFTNGITQSNSTELVGITAGPDGNLWFTENQRGIGRITPAGVVTEFPLFNSPWGITAGPDGNVWFTEFGARRIGRVTPTGAITEFPQLPTGVYPNQITAGPDGNLWFTDYDGVTGHDGVGRITPQGVVTEFTAGITQGRELDGITAGPDGNLWFTERNGYVGRITPQGQATEFPAGDTNYDITAGADGNLWFTGTRGIGRITPAGQVTDVYAENGPDKIAAGPDGNLWFNDFYWIGRLQLSLPTTVGVSGSLGATAPYGQTETLTASVSCANTFGRPDPTGVVTFYDGTTPLGAAAVAGGVAVLNVPTLSVGTHHLTAQYAGDANYDGNTSLATDVRVTAAATTLTLDAPASWTAGDQVTLSASVANTDSSAVPAGYVTFSDFDEPFAVATLSGGIAGAVLTPNFADFAATHWLTATFTPAPGFEEAQTPSPIHPVVSPAAPAKLEIMYSPDFALSGKHISAGAMVEDRYGNPVESSSAPVTVFLSGPGKWRLAGTQTQAAVDGVAGFDLMVTGRGLGFTLTATSPGLAAATSEPFAVSAAVKFKLKLTAPAVAGQPFTITVTAVDSKGRVDPYYQGTVWLIDPAGNGLDGETFLPSDNGKKTFTLTIPTAGKIVLSADDGDALRGLLAIKVK